MNETCPKCGAPKTHDACPRCGLVYEKYDPAAALAQVPPQLVALWNELLANWDERSAHAVFLETCLVQGHSGYAAACYRQRQDDAVAKAQLERLVTRLEQQLVSTGASKRKSRLGLALTILVVLMAAGAGLYFLMVLPRFAP